MNLEKIIELTLRQLSLWKRYHLLRRFPKGALNVAIEALSALHC